MSARRNHAAALTTADRSPPPLGGTILFVRDGEERRVDLRAPRPSYREGRAMVPLMDLWVASLFPDHFLDLQFRIVMCPEGAARCSALIGALELARGFVDLETHELFWDEPSDHGLNGHRVLSIVVLPTPSLPQIEVITPPSPAPISKIATVADLKRLLPHAPLAYPPVELRNFPAGKGSRRAG